MTLAVNITTVPPSETSSLALPLVPLADDVPKLDPLPQASSTALVVADAPKPGFWASLFTRSPEPSADPHLVDANKAYAQSAALHNALATLHRQLPNDATLLQVAPHHWQQLFTGYDAARASAIAAMAGLKVRLDAAAQSGATAALTSRSRSRFEETATNIRAADAECASLRAAAQARHAAATEAAAQTARLAAEKAAEAQAAMVTFRDELKELSGARRASLEERLNKLWTVGYRFGHPFSSENPPDPTAYNFHSFTGCVAPLEVVPALADKGSLVFGKADGHNRLHVSTVRPVRSVAELEEIVSAFMGKGENGAD